MTSTPIKHTVNLTVNGKPYSAEVPTYRMLVDMLRYDLGLTGTKETCSVGVCGACTIMLDGKMASSCITLAVRADGADIQTIEGVADGDKLHPVQEAFIANGGFQCGACEPHRARARTPRTRGSRSRCRTAHHDRPGVRFTARGRRPRGVDDRTARHGRRE